MNSLDSASPGKPCVQNDKKKAFGSCFSDVRTWIQDSSQNAVILRGAEGGVAESILPERTLSQGEGFSLLYETEDSATPGKPCVQNDTGAFQ